MSRKSYRVVAIHCVSSPELSIKSIRDSNNATKKEVRSLRKEVVRLQEKMLDVEKDAKVCKNSVNVLEQS